MRIRSLIVILLALCGGTVLAQMPSLAELEASIDRSPTLQMLDAQYKVARMRLEAERRQQGASLYSHTSFADTDEVVDVGRSRSYRQLSSGIGVRVPVLGSRLQWAQSVSKYELQLAQHDSERELRRRELLKELRNSYASYWAAQQTAALSRRYVQDEAHISQALLLRTQAGLLLDADRLEFMTGFSLARRDQVLAQSEQQRALDTMRMLVNEPVTEGAVLRPTLTPDCLPSLTRMEELAERVPDVQFLREVMLASESSPMESALFPVNAEIRAGYNTSTEWPTDQRGGSASVTLSFDVPINFMSHRRLQLASAAATRSRSRLEYELRRAEVEQQLRGLIHQRAVLVQSLQFAAARLAASEEAVRERELRMAKLAGDVIEQLQQARLAHYHADRDMLSAELALAQWSAQWAMHAPSRCRPRGLYVWSSSALLRQLAQGVSHPLLNETAAQGISSLLVSLDSQQIRDYQSNPTALRAALQAAHGQDLRMELLLGEPSWMLLEHRGQLLDIVRSFAGLHFDAVHLDLEPNQLEHSGIAEPVLLRSLLDTVRAVRTVSPSPVNLSLHPRYLTQQLDGRTLGEHLSEAGTGVTLMIYVSNPQRVVAIAEPLLLRYPDLPMRIALSTEDTLSREESLYYLDADERARRVEMIETQLQSANFHGITLQPAVGAAHAAHVVTGPES